MIIKMKKASKHGTHEHTARSGEYSRKSVSGKGTLALTVMQVLFERDEQREHHVDSHPGAATGNETRVKHHHHHDTEHVAA